MIDHINSMSAGDKRWQLANVGFVVAVALLSGKNVSAQSPPDQRPTFEVASIKPQRDYPRGYQRPVFANGRFTATVPLMQLIAFAYYLPLSPSPRLSGGPDWIRGPEAFYDIKAIYSLSDGLTGSPKAERGRLMLQDLLLERFRLAIHRQSREMDVYVLVVDKGGPKLQRSDMISEKDCPESAANGPAPCGHVWGSPARGLHGQAVTTADLAHYAENWTDRPLLDKTGIKGLFDINTQPFLQAELPLAAVAPEAKGGLNATDAPRTLFEVFESLGLRVKLQKDRVETYVIDSVQKPTDN